MLKFNHVPLVMMQHAACCYNVKCFCTETATLRKLVKQTAVQDSVIQNSC